MTTIAQQKKQLRDFVGTGAAHAVNMILGEIGQDGISLDRLLGNGDELRAHVIQSVTAKARQLWVSNQFASEEASSNYTYPSGYSVKSIETQIDIIAKIFSLSLGNTSEFFRNVLPNREMTSGAEGRFAVASIDAVAARFFPELTDPAERYCRAVNLGIEKLKESRALYNWFEKGQIVLSQFRRLPRTSESLDRIRTEQTGDILVIEAQLGMRHRGRSIRRASEVFAPGEFGLGAWEVINIALTHPERFVRSDQLDIDCAGDEFDPGDGDGLSSAPFLFFYDGRLGFYFRWSDFARDRFGAASGFVPQK